MCIKCGGTGSRKLIKLARKCAAPTSRGQYDIDAYAAGTAPDGYKGWPYKRVHLQKNTAVNNVQTFVDRMHRKYKHEYEQQETYIDVENDSAFDGDPNQIEEYIPAIGTSGSELESD